MAIPVENDWSPLIERETKQEYYLNLRAFLKREYAGGAVYPPMGDIFNALRHTPLCETRAVILGQDPYINKGEAHGFAFSVPVGVRVPPSLANVFKEISDDVGGYIPNNGCLLKWAAQGVLLLNSALTVRAGASRSHAGMGWETFTAAVIDAVNEAERPTAFLLWGRDAQAKAERVTNPRHLVLTAAHPSPLARGAFFGCKHFSKANAFLKANGLGEIDWQIENV